MVGIINKKVSYSELECVYLDLKVVSILGYEKEKGGWDIEDIIKDIQAGSEFPQFFWFLSES